MKTANIGHRGAKGHLPENTLASFQKAIDLGANGIELDVHLSADGQVIVMHDETIDRTTDGKGAVKQQPLAVLKTHRIDFQFEIPTLSEVFDLVDRKVLVNIELKVFETAEPVVLLIEKYVLEKGWQYSDFLISSFDWLALEKVRALHAEIPLGVLTSTDLDLAIAFAKVINAETIHPYFHLLTDENVARMQTQNVKVYTWTVNEFEDLHRVTSLGVDGIITDFPDRL
ncbi:glycerophosphodiester phosphodiesterase [Flavobacterium caeni]|uniref:Glycerophosphoryl diester phosphodiesterase n=1 Tax=Flavobacterium caeni TaxID=490189 RepID=A0A1G5GGV9_9FLAO|nr:glycerophosphodiester phosphodiesterase family protein [Flavobacterium caeni]SCY50529.1 glycerophosphoryl diester phosphodiesterase [Flavobacterium caeni]